MKDATLKQSAKLLSIFEDTPSEQVQAILESGLLADLRDGNIAEINREEFRQLVGLEPLVPVMTVIIDPTRPFARDMAKEDKWKLESDLEYEAGEVTLELVKFLKPGENWVKGTVMAERSKELGANLGQKHAEALLENQHLIPEKWRKYYLVFPGSVWQRRDGDRTVSYLHWSGEQWCLDFYWLDDDFYSDYRVLRPRKPA